MHEQWFNFFYHYGVGGLIFLSGLFALYKGGALKNERPSDTFVTKGLLAGFVTFAIVHGLWIAKVISYTGAK